MNTPPWVFFTFFRLCKWYQIVQHITGEKKLSIKVDPIVDYNLAQNLKAIIQEVNGLDLLLFKAVGRMFISYYYIIIIGFSFSFYVLLLLINTFKSLI